MNQRMSQSGGSVWANPPLIVSYSYSGHTHRIAKEIQAATGGDWCEIYPWQPYPMVFTELLEKATKEIRSGYYPRLLPGFRSARPYTHIFVGAPNWCGTMAPPLASWMMKNDLDGKVVFPFYSHCGGVPCDIQRDIRSLCPGADVREALGVTEDDSHPLAEVLSNWFRRAGIVSDR